MDTLKCSAVNKIMANQLAWLFGGGRIFAARNRCQIATIPALAGIETQERLGRGILLEGR